MKDLGCARGVAVVEGDPQALSRFLDHVEYLLALLLVNGHRLLGDGVAAGAHRPDDITAPRGGHIGKQKGIVCV